MVSGITYFYRAKGMHCAMFWSLVVISLCLAFSAADIEFHCNNKFITAPLSGLENGFEKPRLF